MVFRAPRVLYHTATANLRSAPAVLVGQADIALRRGNLTQMRQCIQHVLGSPHLSAPVRKAALELSVRIPGFWTIDLAMVCIQSQDTDVRRVVAQALGRISNPIV